MRNKKSFSFDEEKDAQEIFNNGFPDGNIDYSKMYLVAKFIRQTYDYGEIRLEREIIRFCKAQDKNFNPIIEADSIKKWVRSALRYDLRKIDSVLVSQKELDLIKDINNNKERKLLFSILVFSKALKKGNVKKDKSNLKTSDNYYIHYNNFMDIIRLSRLNNVSETDLADILYKYKDYFTFYNAERELIRLDFTDKTPQKIITIYDLNNIMDYFSIIFEDHKPMALCENCGKEIKKNSNKQKYCKDCAKIIKKEKHLLVVQKIRANKGNNLVTQ
jgi:hypothetical protein